MVRTNIVFFLRCNTWFSKPTDSGVSQYAKHKKLEVNIRNSNKIKTTSISAALNYRHLTFGLRKGLSGHTSNLFGAFQTKGFALCW